MGKSEFIIKSIKSTLYLYQRLSDYFQVLFLWHDLQLKWPAFLAYHLKQIFFAEYYNHTTHSISQAKLCNAFISSYTNLFPNPGQKVSKGRSTKPIYILWTEFLPIFDLQYFQIFDSAQTICFYIMLSSKFWIILNTEQ